MATSRVEATYYYTYQRKMSLNPVEPRKVKSKHLPPINVCQRGWESPLRASLGTTVPPSAAPTGHRPPAQCCPENRRGYVGLRIDPAKTTSTKLRPPACGS